MKKKPRPHLKTLQHYLDSLPQGEGITLTTFCKIKNYAYAPLLRGYR